MGWGGNLSTYGINNLTKDKALGEQIIFLEGLHTADSKPLFLSCVKTEFGPPTDIHIFPGKKEDWILLLDATIKEVQQQLLQQKNNELSLLQLELTRIGTRQKESDSTGGTRADDFYVSDLFASLDFVVMERSSDNTYRLMGIAPDWLEYFGMKAVSVGKGIEPQSVFSFLENFFIDAESFWEENATGRLKSGTFIEVDRYGDECAIEASAICLGKKKILLLELLGTAYEERKVLLQKARENTLLQEYLEEEVRRRTADIRRREEEIALRLVWAAESRDKETGDHIRRIGLYSEALATAIGWEQQMIDDIRVAAPMHDIGKIGIPDKILQKPGKLLPNEYEIIKSHPEIGAKILENSDVPLLQMAKDVSLCHHEKWDGSGYPGGLIGDAIPQSARIVTIVDVYDALVSERVYKTAKAGEEAIAIMTKEHGISFDPEILECFLSILPNLNWIRQKFSGK